MQVTVTKGRAQQVAGVGWGASSHMLMGETKAETGCRKNSVAGAACHYSEPQEAVGPVEAGVCGL